MNKRSRLLQMRSLISVDWVEEWSSIFSLFKIMSDAVSMLLSKSEGLKPRPLWAKQSLYLKVGKNPSPLWVA
ncbi:hypothetical protein H1Q63_00085 [Desmonostoc muscorum CCALA 125]|nr:hypothetical protein [Desmonostoc muscorum CCALA 125]